MNTFAMWFELKQQLKDEIDRRKSAEANVLREIVHLMEFYEDTDDLKDRDGHQKNAEKLRGMIVAANNGSQPTQDRTAQTSLNNAE